MNTIRKGILQTQITFTVTKRYRGKINIQKPRKPHFERQLLIDISKPIFGTPKYKLPDVALCDRGAKLYVNDVDNPFERILAKECFDWFNTSKMVVFLHVNAISMEDKTPIYATLKKNNMHLRTYGKKIVSMATTGTRYEAVNCLFTSQQNIIFGQPEGIDKMFKILKKAPQLVVLAGIVQDRLMSKNELVEFSKLPNLDMARSQLCTVLHSAAQSLVGQISQSQHTLVASLDQHVELQSKPKEEPSKTEETKGDS